MNVTFAAFGEHIASTRLRALIPQAEVAKLGIGKGSDVLVIGKHFWKWNQIRGFGKVVFDVCDDHFDHPAYGNHYRESAKKADAITCCTDALKGIIKAKTGRDATVIPDPYEQSECPPRIHEKLLWFGHRSNLPDLEREMPRLQEFDVRIVTNLPSDHMFTEWSPEAMGQAFDEAGLVVIPTSQKRPAKSANRAVESIRRGLYVVANPLPAYADLGIWIGDIRQGVEWALTHQDEVMNRILHSQAYVREAFSPQKIGLQWKFLLESL